MIISHALEIIFIKTKKVGGTSFEIALSKFCDETCVITPLATRDENIRRRRGYRSAQNWEAAGFSAHSTAAEVKAAVPAEVWAGYRKITIWRNPFDALISRYYWRGGDRDGVSFEEFAAQNQDLVAANAAIAPLSGAARLDTYLRYERLKGDMRAAGLGLVWDEMQSVNAKGGVRPASASVEAMYAKAPGAARLVAELCAEEIAFFGYEVPGQG